MTAGITPPTNWDGEKVFDWLYGAIYRVDWDRKVTDPWLAANAVIDSIRKLTPEDLCKQHQVPVREFLLLAQRERDNPQVLIAIGYVIGVQHLFNKASDVASKMGQELLDRIAAATDSCSDALRGE